MMIVKNAFIMVGVVATWTVLATTMTSSLLLIEEYCHYGHHKPLMLMMMLAATIGVTEASSLDPQQQQQILNVDSDINNANDDIMKVSTTSSSSDTTIIPEKEKVDEDEILQIPSFTDSFGKYPNPLNITNNDRILYFHPVIMKFPIVVESSLSDHSHLLLMKKRKEKKTHIIHNNNNNDWYYEVSDYSENYTKLHHGINASIINLASELERQNIRNNHIMLKMIRYIKYGMIPRMKHHIQVLRYHLNQQNIFHWFHRKNINNNHLEYVKVHYLKEKLFKKEQQHLDKTTTTTIPMKNDTVKKRYVYYGIGRYDENRISLYQSQLFDNITNSINGYDGLRTIHIGIDLNGPLGTAVYSVCNGYIHSIGYNPELGDYGYVIIIKHYYIRNDNNNITFYALYGHLDERTTRQYRNRYEKYQKQSNASSNSLYIKKGQIIGKIGDINENGGWKIPHVHFQVSINEPIIIHDMPGAVSMNDRNKALYEYFDPRYILGNIY